jgi:hypothetical protein
MTTTAISAQGSTLQIGNSGGGSPVTITTVTAGYPTIFTKTAHGLQNGDVVTISGTLGAPGLLSTFAIRDVNANTFSIDFDSTGLTITGTTVATPATWTKIINFKSFTGFDGQLTEIDASNLDSTAKEYITGLVDSGQMSIVVDIDNANAGHLALRASHIASSLKPYKLTLPDAHTATFNAFVKKLPLDGGVDKILSSSVDLRISGPVTWA